MFTAGLDKQARPARIDSGSYAIAHGASDKPAPSFERESTVHALPPPLPRSAWSQRSLKRNASADQAEGHLVEDEERVWLSLLRRVRDDEEEWQAQLERARALELAEEERAWQLARSRARAELQAEERAWQAAIARAKARLEEEEREWQAAITRTKARLEEEEREWSERLRAAQLELRAAE